jgi:hypothetical protein
LFLAEPAWPLVRIIRTKEVSKPKPEQPKQRKAQGYKQRRLVKLQVSVKNKLQRLLSLQGKNGILTSKLQISLSLLQVQAGLSTKALSESREISKLRNDKQWKSMHVVNN